MKNIVKWVLIVLLLTAFFVGVMVLYDNLSEKYSNNSPINNGEDSVGAPDFEVVDWNGNKVKLSDFAGKPVVLNFWATWCHYCKVEMPDFDKAYENYPNVQFLMVNATDGIQETMEKAKAYVEKEGYKFDVFFDTKLEAVNKYRVSGFPATFFIDANGKIVARGNGALDYESLIKGIEMIK